MILRDPAALTAEPHDLIVVGGGIYGAMLALEGTRRGLRPLLLERHDFGGATSWNSLRIAHGGLRYLQTLDLLRFRESVGERRWLLATFPDLVRPLPCLMPLYGDGLHHPSVFRAALVINDALSRHRNDGLPEAQWLPGGAVLSVSETIHRFPAAIPNGLRGGALWYDGVISNTQRLLVEVLRWAAAAGARPLNYVECTGLLRANGRVTGVRATDRCSGQDIEFRTKLVINAAGPWCREIAAGAGPLVPGLFRPSLAFNALLDRAPPAGMALAVAPRRRGARTYFMYPWQGRVLAGTFHAPWTGSTDNPMPDERLIMTFLSELNEAVPGLSVRREHVIRILAGLLPAAVDGGTILAAREVVHDHGARGGLGGVYTVSGVKYTTARLVADKALRLIFGESRAATGIERPAPVADPDAEAIANLMETDRPCAHAHIARIVRDEAVLQIDDLLLRRTDWGMIPQAAARLAALARETPGPIGGWRGVAAV
jgi:glycerol-3-phosphate dehydrogenase